MSVTLHGPVSKEQLYKIQEVLRHPLQYRDRIKPEDRPVKGEYATAFNKFHPKKVEVNEATVEEAIKYGQFLKKSEEDIAEAIDIYVVRRRGRLAPRQPLSVCALLPAPREEQASTASWKPRPPFEVAEMD